MTLLLVLLGLILRKKALCWAGLAVLWFASTSLVGDTAMRTAEDWQVRVPIAALPSSQAIVVMQQSNCHFQHAVAVALDSAAVEPLASRA